MLLYSCIDEIALREDILIFKTRDFSVEQDWTIPIPGFFVIISKRNIKSILDLTNKEAKETAVRIFGKFGELNQHIINPNLISKPVELVIPKIVYA